MILKINDKVSWVGAWGNDQPKEVTVKSIEFLTEKRNKNSTTEESFIDAINWELVPDWCIVDFTENEHWAYGYQIKPLT